MTITISVTNPAEHQPSELRAIAHFLNVLAANREGGKTLEVATPGNGPAPSVSVDTPPPVADADADDEPNTSTPPEVDSAGYPWDARIHSANKSIVADGTWRKKKGVDPSLVDQVQAELKPLNASAADDAPPPVVETKVDDAPPPPVVEDTPPPAAEQKAEDTPPPPVVETKADGTVTPAQCFKFVTDNKVTPEQIQAALAMIGMEKMNEVFSKPAKAAELLEALQQVTA